MLFRSKIHVRQLLKPEIKLNYGNSPYGEIMRDNAIVDKEAAKQYFRTNLKFANNMLPSGMSTKVKSEPGALIGFAGPRVVKDTTGKDLPEGFQTAEFVQEHGFLDFIVNRKELKDKVNLYIDLVMNLPVRA